MEGDIVSLRMHCPSHPFQRLFHTINFPKQASRKSLRSLIHPSENLAPIHSNRLATTSNKIPATKLNSCISTIVSQRKADSNCKELLREYSGLLQTCSINRSLNDGKTVHGHLIRKGIDPDMHLWACLVNMYAKCGILLCARKVVGEMPRRDAVSWNALISGFVGEGNGEEGVALFCEMWREGTQPNGFIFATGLKACSMCLELNLGKQVHGEVVKFGLLFDVFVGSALVDLYGKCGEVELAESVFFHMQNHNAVSWNALFNAYARFGDGREVLELFGRMIEPEVRLSKFTLSSVTKICASLGKARDGRAVHALVIKIGTELDGFLSGSLVDMYSKCRLAEDARKIFVRIENPDVVTWSAMISCLDQCGSTYEAAELFGDMRRAGIWPNEFTLASLAGAATELDDLQYADSVHAYIRKVGFETNNSVGNALIRMYMKNGAVQDGSRIFEDMPDRDLISWNSLLSGYHNGSVCEEGLAIFNQMLMEGLKPNNYTFVSILRSCASLSIARHGDQVHAHIIKSDNQKDPFVGTALVDMYAKCGSLENATLLFDRLNKKDVFIWTVIISGYAQTDQGEKAVKCFRQMQQEGVRANEFTFASCLRACSSIAALENGRQFHATVIKAGHSGDGFVTSALVDMYGKCGCIKDAEMVFDELVHRDVVLWNTIICGYSQHGHGDKALEVFHHMLDEGVRPDKITFIGVLSACSHVGLIEEGRMYFNSLSEVYRINPTIEHYACMVDILGRAGRLDEVERFIENMTLIPNVMIWQTVLGACRMHANVELGEKAAEKLFEWEPQADSTYILLSNIYAAAGMWDKVTKVRAMMSGQGLKKEPGCSWVEVDGQVHIFLSHDGSHPRSREIYLKLGELGQQLTLLEYVPNTDHVLHNVAEDEKQESLLYHSERLAVAYGLISMVPGKTIRIFKNLRTCGDCHNAIKLISKITNRELVIRDASRFHHFQNGSCSCGDYW